MTNPTPHGQVPEALRIADIFELERDPESLYRLSAAELRRQHARIAELEALGGVQPLSLQKATPAVVDQAQAAINLGASGGVQALSTAPVAFLKSVIALCSHRGYSPANIEGWDKDDKWIADLWRQAESMLAASPTPPAPAEQQAAPKAAPAQQAGEAAGSVPALVCDYCGALTPDPWRSAVLDLIDECPGLTMEQDRWLSRRVKELEFASAPRPMAATEVGNSGFDHKTAADFLNGKTVSDEAVRNFVATSRWAHDERAALSATLLAMHGVLTSREAEIALLKKALLEAETATQPAPAPLSECLRLLNSFEYEGDEDSQAKAFFKAHINEDWFFHVKNSLELALAAQGGKV